MNSEPTVNSMHPNGAVYLSRSLPMELVMDILELAVHAHKVDEPFWTISLAQISRAVQETALRIFYEVFVLRIRTTAVDSSFVGWDGREYPDRQLAFLSWLLHNEDAAPRTHVKHLIFLDDRSFTAQNLGRTAHTQAAYPDNADAADDGPVAGAIWTVDRLTVRFRVDARELYKAGIRATETYNLGRTSAVEGPSDGRLLTQFVAGALIDNDRGYQRALIRSRTWRTLLLPLSDVPEDTQAPALFEQQGLLYVRLDPVVMRPLPARVEEGNRRTIPVFFELLTSEQIAQQWHALLDDIVALLLRRLDVEVILVCHRSYQVEGMPLLKFLRTNFGPKELLHRIRISPGCWEQDLLLHDPFLAYARMVQAGRDPWDIGKPVTPASS